MAQKKAGNPMYTRTITDQNSNYTTTITQDTEPDVLIEEMESQFPDAPQEITDAIHKLADLLTTGGSLNPEADELASFLGLQIT